MCHAHLRPTTCMPRLLLVPRQFSSIHVHARRLTGPRSKTGHSGVTTPASTTAIVLEPGLGASSHTTYDAAERRMQCVALRAGAFSSAARTHGIDKQVHA